MDWEYTRQWGIILALLALGVTLAWGMGFAVYLHRTGSNGWSSTLRLVKSCFAVFLITVPVVIASKESRALWTLVTAGLGRSEGQYQLGILHHVGGSFLLADPGKSVAAFRQAAEQGHPLAQLALARSYFSGRGVLRDQAEALRWAKSSAQAGEPMGLVLAGEVLWDSAPAEAEPLFRQAIPLLRTRVKGGDAEACFTLGTLYLKGRGIPPDPVEGLAWMLAARKLGLSPLQELVIQFFEKSLTAEQRALAAVRRDALL